MNIFWQNISMYFNILVIGFLGAIAHEKQVKHVIGWNFRLLTWDGWFFGKVLAWPYKRTPCHVQKAIKCILINMGNV